MHTITKNKNTTVSNTGLKMEKQQPITELHNNTMTQLYYIALNISTHNSCNINSAWILVCDLN